MAAHNKGKGAAIRWIREHADYQGDDCIQWPFTALRGYGLFGYLGKHHYAHRFMCELIHGPAPSVKHQAAHSCGNGHNRCVNPKHLSWKTLGENMLDKRRHGTTNKAWWGRRGKLTPEQIEEIRATTGPNTVPALAAKFNVTESNIRHIQSGRTWKPGARRPRDWSAEEIAAIKAASRRELVELASRFGVAETTLYRMRKAARSQEPTHVP